MRNKLFVVGVGPGGADQLTSTARETIRRAGCVVAAPRHRALAGGHPNVIALGKFEETFAAVDAALDRNSVAVLVSGDAGVFSLLPLLKKRFPGDDLEVIPGVSSLQSLCAAARETWIDAVVLSGHGRDLGEAKVLDAADQNRKTIFFCGPQWNPRRLCRLLADWDMHHLRLTVGERLSYGDQRLSRGSPAELAAREYDDLSLVLIENPSPWSAPQARPRDDDFLRADVPMTRETVRSAILDELRLRRDSTLWDLGAGTGSVTVAAALFCADGRVCAVEKNPAAAALIARNVKKFHRHNVALYEGDNAAVLPSLPRPTHVFVGGSGPELPELLRAVAALGEGIRVVVSAVAFKTYAAAAENLAGAGFHDFDAVQVAVGRAKKIGGTLIMAAQNPVTIFSAFTAGIQKEGR
ncbi:precorrin-6y C5,15-methyltransferase (decarboxylating) subunit CbiE [Pyramidobacter sp.]|uniref:precorrin-6y C5,15-methyltransferase (decarboxylating) subunit CbiE n=1 Tax=Pyramidobacter sp. TaxID=1943581 RepID=UPI00333430C5